MSPRPGRSSQLATLTRNGVTWTYEYNADGLRTARTSATKDYFYVYNGDKLTQVKVVDKSGDEPQTSIVELSYDASGQPLTMTLDGTTYFYLLNATGDILGLLDEEGNRVIRYACEGYGKSVFYNTDSLADQLGNIDPLAYRGYVLDYGTGLYYLQSRSYNYTTGRFINADRFASTDRGTLGNNMFAYCLNNPQNFIDPSGELAYPGEIHNAVVRHIKNRYGYSSEQFIIYHNGGFGRADLISPDGQVWDVKRDKPKQIAAGKKQVENYVNNTWAKKPNTRLTVGGNEIGIGGFLYKSGSITYSVTYRYAGDGVIAYDYRMVEVDYMRLGLTAAVFVAAVLLGIYSGLPAGSTLPI